MRLFVRFLAWCNHELPRQSFYAKGSRLDSECEERICDENGVQRVVCITKHVTKKMLEHALSNPLYCQSRRVKGKVVRVANAKWPALTCYETFMTCQKVKGIRAKQAFKFILKDAVITPKPLMQMMRCRECSHAVTGQVKRNGAGRKYVYYHCAHRPCPQRSINTNQKELFKQFAAAFEPFSRFTPEVTASLVSTIRERVKDISLYSMKEVGRLKEKQAELHQRLHEIEDLQRKGLLSPAELESFKELKDREIGEVEVEIDAHHSLLS